MTPRSPPRSSSILAAAVEGFDHLRPGCDDRVHAVPLADQAEVTFAGLDDGRNDRPFGGLALRRPRLYRYSRDRRGEYPATHLASWSGILQADAYAGFGSLYAPDRSPGPVAEALCWAHARRKFFELADIATSAPPRCPGAADLAARPCGRHPHRRHLRRRSGGSTASTPAPAWPRVRRRSPRGSPTSRPGCAASGPASLAMLRSPKAMDYMLKRWDGCAHHGDPTTDSMNIRPAIPRTSDHPLQQHPTGMI